MSIIQKEITFELTCGRQYCKRAVFKPYKEAIDIACKKHYFNGMHRKLIDDFKAFVKNNQNTELLVCFGDEFNNEYDAYFVCGTNLHVFYKEMFK